jgi:hypothetical protein
MNVKLFTDKRSVVFALLCLGGFIVNFIAYYPGFIMPDALDQYQQSLSGNYHDWHPPLMAFMWHFWNLFYSGVEVMLVYQLGCLWLSGYFLMTAVRNRWWYIGIFVLLFAPFVQNYAGCIVKDSQMGLSWLLALSILFNRSINKEKITITVARVTALLLLYGCWVRINALSGAVPLFLLWAWAVADEKKNVRILKEFSKIFAVSLIGIWLFSGKIFHAGKTYPENKLYLHDLTNIYVATGDNVYPPVLYTNPNFDTAYLRYKHHPATLDHIWWNGDGKTLLPSSGDEITRELKRAWVSAILKHPGVYLEYRYYGFLYFLGIRIRDKEAEYWPYFPWVQPNDLGIEKKWTILTDWFIKPLSYQRNMFYMEGYFWFFLNIVLAAGLVLIRKGVLRTMYTALTLSGLCYLLPQFLIFQVDRDFRYFYWNCIACTLAVCILLVSRSKHIDINKKGGL